MVAAPSGAVSGGDETILVVEDDDEVREVAIAMLTELGYRVVKARDAANALVVIDSGIPIDLIFTDVMMPGALRSPELARKAKERLPNVAVLFTSGYTQNAIVHGGRLDPGSSCSPSPTRAMHWPGRLGTYWPTRLKDEPLFEHRSRRRSGMYSKAPRCC